jgi:hypothetical protein
MGRACSTNGETRNACRILVGKPEGKRPLGRPRRRRVDNITIYVREVGWDGMDSHSFQRNVTEGRIVDDLKVLSQYLPGGPYHDNLSLGRGLDWGS